MMDMVVVTPRRMNKGGITINIISFSSYLNSPKSFFFTATCCSRKPTQNGADGVDDDDANANANANANDNKSGGKFSADWDKAWSSFKNQGKKKKKKSPLSQFSPNKYVSWNPLRSNYPLSEDVDPIKRTERSNLMLWTSPSFTLGGAIVIISALLIYTLLAPVK